MVKVLVIGGGGFIGSHVADRLTEEGYEVTIFDIVHSKYLANNQKMIVGNITDREALDEAISGVEIVYHFAAIADISESKKDPVQCVNYNVLGTINILEACRKFKIKRFVFSSSIYVYSQHGSFYRSTKQACELLIQNYSDEFNLDFTILRYGSLYGSRANNFNFIHKSIEQALLEGKIERKGDGSEVRDYINVIDASKASVKALDKKYKNSFLMVSGHQSIKINDLLFMIKEIMDGSIEIIYKKGSLEAHYQITPYNFKPNIAKKISIEDSYELGQGILETIYSIHQDLLKTGKIHKK
ncbi:SDR family NAD(P)-dependent oxidoreductase [Flavobacteriaceae bacterium]|nr:SDR family NAD(P)-dependent oxidoreductase [Flavobacteriaceae bacterium]